MSSYLAFYQVSARSDLEVCGKLASLSTYKADRISDAVATGWISDPWGALTHALDLLNNVCIKDIRVTKVSAQSDLEVCGKLASLITYKADCISDAVATEWISDSRSALTIISQNLHVCSFQGTILTDVFISHLSRKSLFCLNHW